MPASNLLFVFSGSVACFRSCDVVSQLVQQGHRVRVVATTSALRFVGAPTLEALTGSPVLSDMFQPGSALEHINLTRWADAVVVCPATAHTINRFAAGFGDDFAGALFLAHDRRKPWLMAPAMNPAMWSHPATQAAVEKLRGWGVEFLPVGTGRTACGEVGAGRLLDPAAIVRCVNAAVARPARRLRVLVTSGGTAEPVDGVRVLTNTSTGATGALLAGHLADEGHEVVLLRARSAVPATLPVREETFGTFAELDAALARLLGQESFDAALHAAAVGDFGVDAVFVDGVARKSASEKLDSAGEVTVRLRRRPKLVDTLRARSRNRGLTVVAFKLTTGADAAAARAAVAPLFARAGADFVVHNDLARRAAATGAFPADIYRPDGAVAVHCPTRTALAAELAHLLASAASPESLSTP
ncbi:MAG: bifunctional phosphopantothenoylcysteine decarboxylase/phosphopantothenate--cysteine ligase CoaBC [Opitutae bacterium]|nr:bifunctional phosphopantothenoylcysteine decarboxylase/phosphopantothenate--cysteine ligase CoaBC [Opitutae bacterium]